MHVVIIANGIIKDVAGSRAIAARADLLLCADGGTLYALEWGLVPDIVIGDMDSLDATHLGRLETAGVRLIRHPARKDETDLELALNEAIRRGATEITILGALGGRIDQTLANIFLLSWSRLNGITVQIVEGTETLYLTRNSVTIHGEKGDIVSLLPLSPEVAGITTTGLEYPLHGESLYLGPSRGVSNVMTDVETTINVRDGLLLVIHNAGGAK